ncbi:lectin, mannose-binding 2 [Nematocida displodere]|uniref:Lectin, mannose-binding 2 n=1 Tax=Nematocida displodere TaxID=1805483 RepID=A0A177ECQ4_9MICR|nr:lectin, mannose-binding 2 [Nematocida displodere]
MFMQTFLGLALCAIQALGDPGKMRLRHNLSLSLYPPFDTRRTNALEGWNTHGDFSIVSQARSSGIALTSHNPGSFGGLSSKKPMNMEEWRVGFEFKVDESASGCGVWITGKPVGMKSSGHFGGSTSIDGVLVFVTQERNALSGEAYPAVGLATGNGRSHQVLATVPVEKSPEFTLRIQYFDKTLTVMYGSDRSELKEVIAHKIETISKKSYLSVSGNTRSASSEIMIRQVMVGELHRYASRKLDEYEDDNHRARSSSVWVVFLLLMSAVGGYLYRQRAPGPTKRRDLKY